MGRPVASRRGTVRRGGDVFEMLIEDGAKESVIPKSIVRRSLSQVPSSDLIPFQQFR